MKNRKIPLAINPPVFFTSVALLIAFLTFGVMASETASKVFSGLLSFISINFGWLYVVSVTGFIAFATWLLFSPYAKIRLGDDDDRPDFSTLTWFSMLFSSGMGIGLVFYGVAEPIMHYSNPPVLEGGTTAAAQAAVPTTLLHWGVHAWAIYLLMGLGIAYFSFRQKMPLAIRSCFYPLLGERIYDWPGHLIDIMAVFGTLFGLATSLSLGAMQVSAGLNHLFDIPHTTQTQLIVIAVITMIAMLSLVTGVKKGIRRLSELNMSIATLLMIFVFIVGPTSFLINSFIENIGSYINVLFTRSLTLGTMNPGEAKWIRDWTVFYWGWWIAWTPFVGMFVARISRGRTIGEFVLGVLLVPTALTIAWFTVFGDTALHLEVIENAGIAAAVKEDLSTAIYVMLEHLPLSAFTGLLAATVVSIFFVTSSDSASFVVDMLTSGGNPNPPIWQRVFWATAEGACAAVLLYAGGQVAIDSLQAVVISTGLPICITLILVAWGLVRSLKQENMNKTPGNPLENESIKAQTENS